MASPFGPYDLDGSGLLHTADRVKGVITIADEASPTAIRWWCRSAADGGSEHPAPAEVRLAGRLPPAARANGFRNVINHGFSTMARAVEGLNRSVFSGDVSRLEAIDVKFTKPLVLPAEVGLYIDDDRLFVGDAPGGPAYLVGTYGVRS